MLVPGAISTQVVLNVMIASGFAGSSVPSRAELKMLMSEMCPPSEAGAVPSPAIRLVTPAISKFCEWWAMNSPTKPPK